MKHTHVLIVIHSQQDVELHSDRTDKGQHQHTCSFLNSGMGERLKKWLCIILQ